MKRWIRAPQSNIQPHSGAVLGVSLNPGEQVRWIYTILPDGSRVVTGYDIIAPCIAEKRKKKISRSLRKRSSKQY
jgi:hypothetical protein